MTRGQGARNAVPPRTRKACVLRPWEKFEKNWENASVRNVSQKWNNLDIFETKLRLVSLLWEIFQSRIWDEYKKENEISLRQEKEKIEPFFFLGRLACALCLSTLSFKTKDRTQEVKKGTLKIQSSLCVCSFRRKVVLLLQKHKNVVLLFLLHEYISTWMWDLIFK